LLRGGKGRSLNGVNGSEGASDSVGLCEREGASEPRAEMEVVERFLRGVLGLRIAAAAWASGDWNRRKYRVASDSFGFGGASSSERSRLAEESEEWERLGVIGVVGERLGIMSLVGTSSERKFIVSGAKGGVWSPRRNVWEKVLLSFLRQL